MIISEHDFIVFFIVYSLVSWSIDFLSDSMITKNETKIGILQYVHHLVSVSHISILLLLFFSKSIKLACYAIIVNMIVQVGWLINNNRCWYTTMINKMIDPDKPNRKWRGGFQTFITHYIRGDSWAYSDIYKTSMTVPSEIINISSILYLIKLLF